MLERIREIATPVVNAFNLNIIHIEYKEAGARSILRIFIDGPGGVTIDDCAEVSKEINVRLDVANFIPHKYTLEISSPGLTRKLRTVEDFENSVGKRVKIVSVAGCFIGQLAHFGEGVAEIVAGEKRDRVRFDEIQRANLELDPGDLKKVKGGVRR